MRISDWSSDVCSSDLLAAELREDRFDGFLEGVLPGQKDGQIGFGFLFGQHFDMVGVIGLRRVVLRLFGGDRGVPHRDLQFHPRRCRISRSEEHTSELQSLMRISYAVFCLKKKQY